jgi:hypothetical protein
MKLWIDDVRPAPEGYVWARSTEDAIFIISAYSKLLDYICYRIDEPQTLPWFEVIDIDHDAGEYADCGGDYIKVLDWMEENHIKAPIRIHSMNPVGVANMRAIIERNGWKEVF